MSIFAKFRMAKFLDYFIYTKAYPFTVGLLFILSLIDMKLVDVLFTNLISAQENKDIRRATLIVNLREGATEILKVVAVLFTNRYMKRIGGVILFNVIYIVGLVMLYMFEDSRTRKTSNLVLATLTISLGKTGFVLLIGFIGDQLRKPSKRKFKPTRPDKTSEDRTIRLTLVWWVFPWALSASIAPFFGLSVTKSIILLTTLLGAALGVLCSGDCLVGYDDKSKKDSDENHAKDEASVGKLLKLFLVWISLILYTIVAGAGTTFFLQQANKINSGFPVVTFLIFKHAVNVLVSVLFSKCGKNLFTHLAWGMLFSFSSSVLAFWTEAFQHGIWLLTPQYILLGLAEGLGRDAFEGYFRDRIQGIKLTIRSKYVVQLFTGLGKFLSYVILSLILGFSGLDVSDLWSYYKLLMVASSMSLLVSLYLWLSEEPIPPKGLSSDVFFPLTGQTMSEDALAPPPPASAPPKPIHMPPSPPRHPPPPPVCLLCRQLMEEGSWTRDSNGVIISDCSRRIMYC